MVFLGGKSVKHGRRLRQGTWTLGLKNNLAKLDKALQSNAIMLVPLDPRK